MNFFRALKKPQEMDYGFQTDSQSNHYVAKQNLELLITSHTTKEDKAMGNTIGKAMGKTVDIHYKSYVNNIYLPGNINLYKLT